MKIRILFRDFKDDYPLPTPLHCEDVEMYPTNIHVNGREREMILEVPDEEIKKLFEVPVVTPTIIKKEES